MNDDSDSGVIFWYTRAQAISDGTLIDATSLGKEAGFRFPVAVTCTVWESYVRVPPGVEAQDETGRLWDIVWMLRYAIRQGDSKSDTIFFTVLVRNDAQAPQPVRLKAVCGPNDDATPCLTIMLPCED